jgi:uncharacterized membrane protein YkoI
MKKIMLLSVACLVAGLADAQKLKSSEVPAAVTAAFAKNFPKAKEVKWSKEGTSEFEAEFEIAELEQAANFDKTGKLLETETEIKKSELPQAIQAAIAKEFAGFTLDEPEKVEIPGKALLYEMELKKDKVKYEVQFSADGKVVKKEEMKAKKKEKEGKD